ncbi:SUV3 C-terminal domain-containing protein [Hydrogenimonas thermophila]|uniref:helicase-related protein n=1 Tax=Hydrogenimonas thermophila TaxID=223786 RepID=UPI002936FD82|nr:helicase-related protein [Hydrogenimonas thermophila]WOE69139.1 SUV3 C-terminal domain-containing protein [Hydrogenimonas thermophila]WOE71649.1 SUV3 C-terminal domain-containing protein [Hydrogenimonas thermophila]
MAKKKKKLIKYNQTIRKIFGGEGFDEGITRVPLDNLIEMAMILSLKEQHLTKADLVKAFRRVWSNGDTADRALITEYLKSLETTFKADKTVTSQEARLEKIDEILSDIEHTPGEAVAIRELFEDVKLKKITPKRIQKSLMKLRNAKKRNSLEEKFDGAFDDDGNFHFFHSFAFKIFDEQFHKILELSCRPFEDEEILTLDEEELGKRLESCKESAIRKREEEIKQFLEIASKPNRYLDIEQKLKAIKRIPENCDFAFVPIPSEYLHEILFNQFEIKDIEVLSDSFRLFKRFEKELFKNPEWKVRYKLLLEVQMRWLYQAIWENEHLPIDEDFEMRRNEVEAQFDAELIALKDALLSEAEGLEMRDEQVETIIANSVIDAISQKEVLEIPYKTLKRINRHFARQIEGFKLKKQREELLARTIRDFKNLFPLAREMGRKLIFHVGPTNSGKTYAAMEKLKEADTGYYLAPLRLLALEGYETLKNSGLEASLITGEEQIIDEEAAHISSTIEMANFQVDVDVCVIDEVQMIADPDRGWAWANAIIGIPAHTVIMTGSEDALEAVQELAEWLDEELEVVRFERKSPLILNSNSTSLKKLEPSTAIVAFSRRDVLALKEQLSGRYDVSVVYGNLSPEVRREEARRFREGESQILVATDAIAMGLNLPIRTILFARDSKFDGQSRRLLTPSEIRQIAGRAGRYGLHEEGFVGALTGPVLNTITELIDEPSPSIHGPYRVMANFDHIDLIAKIIETQSLSEILGFFVKHMQFDGPFIAANIENMLEIAKMVDLYNLDLKTKYHLACAPLSLGSPYLESVFHRYLISLERQEPIPFNLPEHLPQVAQTSDMLFEAEEMVKEVSLYLWLSYRFSDSFIDTENALEARKILNDFIERSLRQGVFARACKRCGKPLPPNFKFGICQECYRGGRQIRRYIKK